MRVAVTGARGFIGSHVTRHLTDAGHEVVPLGRRPDGGELAVVGAPAPRPSGAGLADLLAGVDAVIHLAARRVDSPTTPLADYLEPNVVLTERLLHAAVAVGVGRFVLASSRMVYPSWVEGAVREDCPHGPDTVYGVSKRTAEDLLRINADRSSLVGLALRIGQVVGAGDEGRGILPRFIERARAGQPVTVTGSGAAVRDFVDVRDVVRAFELALTAPTAVPAVNIGGPRPRSVAELARAVADAAGLGPEGVVHEPVEREDTSHYSLDLELARTELGWVPRIPLEETVRDRLEGEAR